MRRADSSDEALDSGSFGSTEFTVLEIDVVDDLGDRTKRRMVRRQPLPQHLEGAAITLVGEICLEHIDRFQVQLYTVCKFSQLSVIISVV